MEEQNINKDLNELYIFFTLILFSYNSWLAYIAFIDYNIENNFERI